jgi:hypothetical protein
MPPKLKVKPPKEDAVCPSPNDSSSSSSSSSSSASGGGAKETSPLPASALACLGADVNFAETNNGSPTQSRAYLDSLSELELRICSIARDHLETSFDISRSTGYLTWKSKNEMK